MRWVLHHGVDGLRARHQAARSEAARAEGPTRGRVPRAGAMHSSRLPDGAHLLRLLPAALRPPDL
eukprot:3182747-Prymnesium_polylepis.1